MDIVPLPPRRMCKSNYIYLYFFSFQVVDRRGVEAKGRCRSTPIKTTGQGL